MIEVNGLWKSFGKVVAVRNLSLQVPAGELFCFLGPNGAGKTTTLKMLTGLMRPDRGTIRIDGIDLLRDPVGVKRLIGYIPDMPFLYERLTPVEFLEFVADLYQIPRATAEAFRIDWFERFGLIDLQGKLIGELSHGQRQRVIYVATFLHDPKVIFIDEPLVGLDPFSIRLIKDILRAKARGGMTIFLTTHILAVAEEIADRVGIIAHGELIAADKVATLLQQHADQERLEDVFLKLTADVPESTSPTSANQG